VISTRHVRVLCVLLAVALLPVLRHVYFGPEEPPAGGLEHVLPAELGDSGEPQPGRNRADWVRENLGTEDFVTRRYPGGIEFFAGRSLDWKKLFHFPELGLSYGKPRSGERHVVVAGIPVRLVEFRTSDSYHLAAMTFLCGDETVARPLLYSLGTVTRLVEERRPMTLVYVQSGAKPDEEAAVEQRLLALVTAAARALLAAPE